MVLRVSRAMMVVDAAARVTAGRARWLSRSARPPVPCAPYIPEAGSQPSQSEKHTIRTSPSQKLGMLAPKMEPSVLSRSTSDRGRAAESTPSAMPHPVERKSAVVVRSRVARKRISTSPSTGWRIRMDRPRSPWSTWAIQRAYCSGSGSSSPRSVAQARHVLLARLRPQHDLGGIARRQVQDEEHHHRDPEQDRHQQEQTPEEVASHRAPAT